MTDLHKSSDRLIFLLGEPNWQTFLRNIQTILLMFLVAPCQPVFAQQEISLWGEGVAPASKGTHL